MKKKTLVSLVMVISLLVWGGGIGYAKVTGRCDNCHTMHNSQGGADLYATVYDTLLIGDCVGCHSHETAITYSLGTSTVPVVYTTNSAPGTTLAGGNFYWVAQADSDAKGHNVYGIITQDSAITVAEGAPGDANGDCGDICCHKTLATATNNHGTPGGCQGCHLDVQHHTDDGPSGTKYVGAAPWYRFLVGHDTGVPDGTYGVHGIEDDDWQATSSETDHNEYKGLTGEGSGTLKGGDGTMTAFCSGCHGNFHTDQDTGTAGEWTRHPSDFVIPTTGEYASMSTLYNPNVPVARPSGFNWAGNTPGGTVAPGAEMVMCLSCHRPHGTEHDDLLRWNYADMIAGDNTKSGGCFACHTAKND